MAIAARADVGCGFHLHMTGGAAAVANPFPVGQLDNGQCRAGSAMTPSLFTWFGDAFVDQQGRGCWWTPPTSVLQCDPLQAQPSHGFVIACNGTVSYNDQPTFWSCQTGDDDQVNIYTQPNGSNCSEIVLVVDSCIPTCVDGVPQSPPPLPPPPPSSPDTSSSSTSSSSSSDSSLSSSSESSLSSSPPPEATSSPSGPSPTSSPTVETPTETTTTNTDTTTVATTTTTTPSSSSTTPSVPPSVTPFLSSDTTTTSTTPTTTPATDTTSSSSTNTDTTSSSSSSSSFTPPVPLPSPPPTPSTCPMDVIGDGWEFPHLMVPVDRANPSTAYGPSSFGQLSPNASTLYSFDIPATDGARTCSLFFAFPSTAEISSGEYTFTFTPPGGNGGGGGGGEVDFAFLAEPAAPFVTWDSMPPVAADLGAVALRPGNRYVISSFPCPAGRRISFAMREPPDGIGSGSGGGGGTGPAAADTCLYYFQDIVPVPFGLYISKC